MSWQLLAILIETWIMFYDKRYVAQDICIPFRTTWQPTGYVLSFEASIGPRTHQKLEILTALLAHIVKSICLLEKTF